jgi:hypothetical protein
VRGAEGCCWKTVPDDIEAERGQVPENLSPDGSITDSKEVRHVLDDDISGSKLANDSEHLTPQNGFGMLKAVSLARCAGSLAGEPSGDDVDSLGVMSSNCSNVVEDGDAWPPSGEDASPPRIDLTEPCVLKAGEVQSVGKESDSVE